MVEWRHDILLVSLVLSFSSYDTFFWRFTIIDFK